MHIGESGFKRCLLGVLYTLKFVDINFIFGKIKCGKPRFNREERKFFNDRKFVLMPGNRRYKSAILQYFYDFYLRFPGMRTNLRSLKNFRSSRLNRGLPH